MSDSSKSGAPGPADEQTNEAISEATTGADGFTVADTPPDPLDRLAERAKADPGAPFAPDVIEALVELRRRDRAASEKLRARLKQAGVRVAELDAVMAAEAGDDERRPTHADILIDIAGEAELFHALDLTPFADVMIGEHRETWPVRSRGFRRWLAHAFYKGHGGAPSAEAMQAALVSAAVRTRV
jgi:hypothetical protein